MLAGPEPARLVLGCREAQIALDCAHARDSARCHRGLQAPFPGGTVPVSRTTAFFTSTVMSLNSGVSKALFRRALQLLVARLFLRA